MTLWLVLAALTLARARAAEVVFANPIVRQRADPHLTLHRDGWYYFTATVPEYDRLEVRRARTIPELGAAERKVIWRGTREFNPSPGAPMVRLTSAFRWPTRQGNDERTD